VSNFGALNRHFGALWRISREHLTGPGFLCNPLKMKAEGVGFEPTVSCPTSVFKTGEAGVKR
jgi:hypothetical protein